MSATMTLEPGGSGDLPLLELLEGGDRMFKIVDVAGAAAVGSVGFWTKEWRDKQAYERGRLDGRAGVPGPRHRGGGDRTGDRARQVRPTREFEFPKRHFMTCND